MANKIYILVAVDLEKPVADLVSHVAGRAYTMDGVSDVHAIEVDGATGETLMKSKDSKDNHAI